MSAEVCRGKPGGGVLGVRAIKAGVGIPLFLN
jgi:hypothetical protein